MKDLKQIPVKYLLPIRWWDFLKFLFLSPEEFEQGQEIPLNQAFAEFQEKYDLPVGLTH